MLQFLTADHPPKGDPYALLLVILLAIVFVVWILIRNAKQKKAAHPEPDEAEKARLIALAKMILPGRVEHFAALTGLRPKRVKITSAKTRFGSCSSKGSICFSWRLMQYPPEAIDYVVVHELAHLKHMNHSPAFHALVAKYLPDHRQRRALLKR